MSENRRSTSKIPQILDKQAPGNSHTQAGRREHYRRDREAAEVDEQGVFAEDAETTDRTSAMDLFNHEALKALLADTTRLCVSLYMHTRPTAELAQNRIEFKNLLRSAESQLVELGMDAPEATELLVPAWELLENMPFWQSTTEGLALFRSPELFRVYRAIQPPKDTCLVNDHFEIQPLLPLLNGEGRFFVLTLSQDDIRLMRGNRERIAEVPLEGVPRNMTEALNEEPERHAFNRNAAFGAGQQFHGHSQAPEDTDDRLDRFFHMIDRGLHKYLKNETAPLVLAGVEYLFPIYRRANTYPHLLEEGIHGNQKLHSAQDLHDLAWPLVQPLFLKAQEDAIRRYNEAKAMPNLIAQALEEIVPSAAFGRIDTLFTAIGAQSFGTFDAEGSVVRIHDPQEPGDDDLINFAAMQVLLHSGTTYVLPPESMPDGAIIAALYRY